MKKLQLGVLAGKPLSVATETFSTVSYVTA